MEQTVNKSGTKNAWPGKFIENPVYATTLPGTYLENENLFFDDAELPLVFFTEIGSLDLKAYASFFEDFKSIDMVNFREDAIYVIDNEKEPLKRAVSTLTSMDFVVGNDVLARIIRDGKTQKLKMIPNNVKIIGGFTAYQVFELKQWESVEFYAKNAPELIVGGIVISPYAYVQAFNWHAGSVFSIGREAFGDCGLQLPESCSYVSRKHCEITYERENKFVLTDMSTNGTTVRFRIS